MAPFPSQVGSSHVSIECANHVSIQYDSWQTRVPHYLDTRPLVCLFMCVGDLAEHGPFQRSPRAVRQRAGGVRRHATWPQRLRALPRVPGTTSHHIRPQHRAACVFSHVGVETYSSSFSVWWTYSLCVALLRVLQVEVPPPKVTFCSPACVHEHRLRTSGTYVRQCLRVRETHQTIVV